MVIFSYTFFFVKMTVYVTGRSGSSGFVSRNAMLLSPTAGNGNSYRVPGVRLFLFQFLFLE